MVISRAPGPPWTLRHAAKPFAEPGAQQDKGARRKQDSRRLRLLALALLARRRGLWQEAAVVKRGLDELHDSPPVVVD
eukprot:908010-Prymnesium_polylepis.1